jgi:hypothetical protein
LREYRWTVGDQDGNQSEQEKTAPPHSNYLVGAGHQPRHDSPGRSGTAFKERQTLMDEDIPLPFDLPAVARKRVSAFDGGSITSDGVVMLLAQAERRLGIADRLAQVIPDGRDADRVVHLKAVQAHGEGANARQILDYLSRELGMTVRPNHLGMALQRHRRAGRLENRDQRWYLPPSG